MTDTSPETGPTPARKISSASQDLFNAVMSLHVGAEFVERELDAAFDHARLVNHAESSAQMQPLRTAEEQFREGRLEKQAAADAVVTGIVGKAASEAADDSILAAAGAVVAAAEASRMQEHLDAACIAAAIAFAQAPADAARLVEPARRVRPASERIVALATEHNRLAKRSVLAATLAAEMLANGLTADELATSVLFADGIAAVLAAKNVVRESDALNRAARNHRDSASSAVGTPPHEEPSGVSSGARPFAVAATAIAAADANRAHVESKVAEIEAEAAWALVPIDVDRILECERNAWAASRRAVELVAEHTRLAI